MPFTTIDNEFVPNTFIRLSPESAIKISICTYIKRNKINNAYRSSPTFMFKKSHRQAINNIVNDEGWNDYVVSRSVSRHRHEMSPHVRFLFAAINMQIPTLKTQLHVEQWKVMILIRDLYKTVRVERWICKTQQWLIQMVNHSRLLDRIRIIDFDGPMSIQIWMKHST